MTEINIDYKPLKTLEIHEIVRYDTVEDFLISNTQSDLTIRWIDGVIYTFYGLPQTHELVKDVTDKGIGHWSEMHFAECKEYTKTLKTPYGQEILVVDSSFSVVQTTVIKWLKNSEHWK